MVNDSAVRILTIHAANLSFSPVRYNVVVEVVFFEWTFHWLVEVAYNLLNEKGHI